MTAPSEPRMFCLGCEYPLDGLRDPRCPECGREFDPDDPMSFSRHLEQSEVVYRARDALDAHFYRGILEAQGIPAVVMGEVLSAINPALGMVPGSLPTLCVRRGDVEQARAVLAEALARGRPAAKGEPVATEEAWTCPHCGEQIEGQFDVCWNCQAERPA
jgi:predicted amidophosphoribosyltransferase